MSGRRHGHVLRPDRQRRPVAVRPEEEGKASGANNAIREVGGVFGVAVLASVFSANGSYASPQAYVDGLVPAMAIGAAVVAVAAVVALAIPGRIAAGEGLGQPVLPLVGRQPEEQATAS